MLLASADTPLVLVDVREAWEYAAGCIPGAVNVPRELLLMGTLALGHRCACVVCVSVHAVVFQGREREEEDVCILGRCGWTHVHVYVTTPRLTPWQLGSFSKH